VPKQNVYTMSRRAPRPKRSADVYTRTHHQDDNEPNAKKPRFDYRNPSTLAPDAPEDDDVLELDEIGKTGGVKRNAVNIDGYDSDSDNDNFDARARAAAKAKDQAAKAKQEDANDMFADLDEPDGDDDEELTREGKGKKDVRFLDVDEIEGQVQSSKSGGHVSADFSLRGAGKPTAKDAESSSESGDEEERDDVPSDVDDEVGAGGKKKHAPKLDAFNMHLEQEEGRFDETGNFVRKAMDPDAVHDNWLEGVSKKDMKRAREAQQQREEERRQKDREDEALLTEDLLGTLIRNLQIGETALEALQRLNKAKPKEKRKPKWQQKKKDKQNGHANGDSMDVDPSAEDAAETKRKEAVEAITGAADQLLTRGDLEVYEHERELLMRMYKRETGEDWAERRPTDDATDGATSDSKMWEYRWWDGRDGGQHHGPYDDETMRAWNEAGYFGEGVEFKTVGGDEWSRLADF
jgi:CD2 antigen cytoplasmic tail-binding protein 2